MPCNPMLAVKFDPKKLVFPVYASAKIDGWRCMGDDGTAYSRKLLPFKNIFLQKFFADNAFYIQGLDGELTVDGCAGEGVIARTAAGIGSMGGEPNFTFHVFDRWDRAEFPFEARLRMLRPSVGRIVKHEQRLVFNMDELMEFEAEKLLLGYEGLIIRDPQGIYKAGRSTVNEGGMLKVKRFTDDEAVIIGYKELMHNGNEATRNELGHTKRSSHAANKTGLDTLGAWVCRGLNGRWHGVEFDVSAGSMDAATKAAEWAVREQRIGDVVTYKWFEPGSKDKPRHPLYKCLRDRIDMS